MEHGWISASMPAHGDSRCWSSEKSTSVAWPRHSLSLLCALLQENNRTARFQGTINSERRVNLIRRAFSQELARRKDCYFVQNGATSHTANWSLLPLGVSGEQVYWRVASEFSRFDPVRFSPMRHSCRQSRCQQPVRSITAARQRAASRVVLFQEVLRRVFRSVLTRCDATERRCFEYLS
jgi:hypothetical protein